jgi:hypothetical protein
MMAFPETAPSTLYLTMRKNNEIRLGPQDKRSFHEREEGNPQTGMIVLLAIAVGIATARALRDTSFLLSMCLFFYSLFKKRKTTHPCYPDANHKPNATLIDNDSRPWR